MFLGAGGRGGTGWGRGAESTPAQGKAAAAAAVNKRGSLAPCARAPGHPSALCSCFALVAPKGLTLKPEIAEAAEAAYISAEKGGGAMQVDAG
eukprot:1157856-Pelagomonas_calceolata.AAC.1